MLSYVLHHRVVVNGPSTEMFDRVPSDQRTLIALRTRSRTGAAQVDAAATLTCAVAWVADEAVPEFTAVPLRAQTSPCSSSRRVTLTWMRATLETLAARDTPWTATGVGQAEKNS